MDAAGINKLFRELGLTLGSVESFTGGNFAGEITSISGASHFFKGSLVTYATEEKNRILSIPYEMIDKYGVVSAEIAGEMASRGRALLNVDYCISFTGNAGPSAMENKPVGEVYIGIAFANKTQVFTYHLTGDRENIQKEAIKIAYEILENILIKNDQTPTIK
ncbi:MAG: CinA family protein [Bacilli bacterium]|nr:CinA family protein [Bacilli bacterium]